MDVAVKDVNWAEAGLSADMLVKATSTTGFLKSLSHPARLVLLCRLAEGPANVSELEATLNLPQAEVSKQLARLRLDGLVITRRTGRIITYALKDERTVRVMRLLHAEFCT